MEQTEKVSVNVNPATLGQMDLLIDQGFFSSRTDLVNQAVREMLRRYEGTIQDTKERARRENRTWFLGICEIGEEELRQAWKQGNRIRLEGYGLLILPPELDDLILQ